LPLCIIERITT